MEQHRRGGPGDLERITVESCTVCLATRRPILCRTPGNFATVSLMHFSPGLTYSTRLPLKYTTGTTINWAHFNPRIRGALWARPRIFLNCKTGPRIYHGIGADAHLLRPSAAPRKVLRSRFPPNEELPASHSHPRVYVSLSPRLLHRFR